MAARDEIGEEYSRAGGSCGESVCVFNGRFLYSTAVGGKENRKRRQ